MAISKAIKFLNDFSLNATFREKCYLVESKDLLLKERDFTEFEFEDALNMKLVKCYTAEDAEQIYQVKQWFKML